MGSVFPFRRPWLIEVKTQIIAPYPGAPEESYDQLLELCPIELFQQFDAETISAMVNDRWITTDIEKSECLRRSDSPKTIILSRWQNLGKHLSHLR